MWKDGNAKRQRKNLDCQSYQQYPSTANDQALVDMRPSKYQAINPGVHVVRKEVNMMIALICLLLPLQLGREK